MPSQLWQRLRAGRTFADLTQSDVAKACGVGRSSVTHWEARDGDTRTKPDIHQLSILAKLYRLPLEWLMNDLANPEDVWRVGAQYDPKQAAPASIAPPEKDLPRVKDAFLRAVEFEVLTREPAKADGFSSNIGQGWTKVRADFTHEDLVVELVIAEGGSLDMAAISRLLLLERASGHPLRKVLVALCRGQSFTEASLAETLSVFGVLVIPVSTPAEAAEKIISIAG